MFTNKLAFTVSLTLLLLNGCTFSGVGHGYLSVTGELRNKNGEKIENCYAQLNELTNLDKPKKIGGSFSTRFIIEPRTRQYSINIECAGYQIFKKQIRYSTKEKLIKLGEITLNDKTET